MIRDMTKGLSSGNRARVELLSDAQLSALIHNLQGQVRALRQLQRSRQKPLHRQRWQQN